MGLLDLITRGRKRPAAGPAAPAAAGTSEARRRERHHTVATVRWQVAVAGTYSTEWEAGRIVDLSRSGAKLAVPGTLVVGQMLLIELPLAPPVTLTGAVRHVQTLPAGGSIAGIMFVDRNAMIEESIVDFIDRNRAQALATAKHAS